jgi:hypothetical protein
MEQKFKEFKEFYEKHGGGLVAEFDNSETTIYRYEEWGVFITEKVQVTTMVYLETTDDETTFVPYKLDHRIVVCSDSGYEYYIALNISTPAELSELITTLKKYLK